MTRTDAAARILTFVTTRPRTFRQIERLFDRRDQRTAESVVHAMRNAGEIVFVEDGPIGTPAKFHAPSA